MPLARTMRPGDVIHITDRQTGEERLSLAYSRDGDGRWARQILVAEGMRWVLRTGEGIAVDSDCVIKATRRWSLVFLTGEATRVRFAKAGQVQPQDVMEALS